MYPATQIKIYGIGDFKTLALRENVMAALVRYPIKVDISLISAVHDIAQSGIGQTPALAIDGQIVSEGDVPTVDNLTTMLRNRALYRSKLYLLEKIIVPVDFSASSVNALHYAVNLASQFGAGIEVVHITDSLFDENTRSALTHQHKLKAELDNLVQQFKPNPSLPALDKFQDLRITSRLHFGFPEDILIEMSMKYDLVVMGTQGERGGLSGLVGSVSTQVANEAHCPVILVPTTFQSDGKISTILYASNFESNDVEKIRQVVGFANKLNAQIHFVHVSDIKSNKDRLEKELFHISYDQTATKKPFIFRHLSGGMGLSRTLNDYAFYEGIQMMVLVTHRRGLIQRFLHKSATNEMVFRGQFPILVVHQFNDVRLI